MHRISCRHVLVMGLAFLACRGLGLPSPDSAAAAAAAQGAPLKLADLDVPLTISEVAGVDRRQDICSTGVPLPCGLLREPEGIAVFDPSGKAVAAQFRVLERWRERAAGQDDESVKWLLATFMADVPKGGKAVYRLRAGANPPPALPVKIAEKGDAFELGGLTFKKDFSTPFELLLTDAAGKDQSAVGLPITWSVWESGPVRACLRAESPTDHSRFGFIAWIWAYAGQQRWDMTVALKNTPNKMVGPFYFKDFSIAWSPPALNDARDFVLAGEWGRPAVGKLAAGPATLYQASDGADNWDKLPNSGWYAIVMDWSPDKKLAKAGLSSFRGYKVTQGQTELSAGNYAQGAAAISDGAATAQVLVRNFRQQYPKAVEAAPGRLIARLWPKQYEGYGGLHWLDDCQRKAHDVSLRMTNVAADAARLEFDSRAFDAPLIAHCGLGWYRKAGANGVLPESLKEAAPKVATTQPADLNNWVTFGGDVSDRIRRRYHDYPMDGFVRGGDPSAAYRTYHGMRHSAGMTPFWVDDYRYPRDAGLIRPGYCAPPRATGKYRQGTIHHGYMAWNEQHLCCRELFDAWRLFGDPLAFEAVRDLGSYCQFFADARSKSTGKASDTNLGDTRTDGLPLSSLCEAYRILGGKERMDSLVRFAGYCWRRVDKARGNYGSMPGPGDWAGSKATDIVEKPFMMSQVMDGLRAYYEITGDENAFDQLTGMTNFLLAEGGHGEWGIPYVVQLVPERYAEYRKMILETKAAAANSTADLQGSRYLSWCYRYTGDAAIRQFVEQLRIKPEEKTRTLDAFGVKADVAPPEPVKDLAAEALGGGKVRLTWTAPAGEPVRYQLKWADRPIVDRLKYPDEKDAKCNWWAASNVTGEPAPSAAGAKETMAIDGVSAGKRFVAVRSFDAACNRSGVSNVVEVDAR